MRFLIGVLALGLALMTVSSRRTGNAGVRLIKQFEGFEPRKYIDAAGHPTIGYGHKIRPGENFDGVTLSQAQAETLLRADLADAERAVSRNVRVRINQNQFDALVSWFFNLGEGAATINSTLLKRLNAGDYRGAAAQFPVWNKARVAGMLKPLAGLTARRAAEKALFEAPEQVA